MVLELRTEGILPKAATGTPVKALCSRQVISCP